MSSTGWRARSRRGDGVFLLDRTSDAEPQPVGVHDRRRARAGRRRARAAGRGRDPRDRHGHATPASTRGSGPSTSSRSCRSASTTMDDCIELARDFGERIATRFDLPVFLYANAATRPERVKLADVRRGQYEGLKDEIEEPGREPDFGPAAAPSVGRGGRGRRPTVPDRLQHQPRLARRRAGQADRPPRPRIGRRAAEGPGQRLLDRGARSRPGLDEPARLRASPRCGWSGRRSATSPPRTASTLAESELIGLAPLAAFLAVADRADAPPEDPVERRLAAAADFLRLRDFSPMQALELRLEAARADRRHGDERRAVPAHPRRPQRRADAGPADRRRVGGRDPRRRRPDGRAPGRRRAAVGGRCRRPGRAPTRRSSPAGRAGSSRSARGRRSRPRSRPRATTLGPLRPARRRRRLRSRRASSTRTRTSCSRGSREGEWQLRQRGAGYLEILEAGGGILSTVAATREASTEELLAHGRRWLDEMLGHGVTTIEAKSGYGLDLETEIRLIEAAYQLGSRGPDRHRPDLPRRARGPARVPRRARTAPRRTSARSSRTSCPASPPTAGRGSATSSARTACSARTSRGASCEAAAGYGLAARGCTPTSWPRPVARSWRPSSVPRRPTTSRRRPRRASTRSPRGRRRRPAGRRDGPAGDDLVPDEGPRRAGPDVHRSRHPGRARHRLQPGHLADREPAAGDDRRLPRAAD